LSFSFVDHELCRIKPKLHPVITLRHLESKANVNLTKHEGILFIIRDKKHQTHASERLILVVLFHSSRLPDIARLRGHLGLRGKDNLPKRFGLREEGGPRACQPDVRTPDPLGHLQPVQKMTGQIMMVVG
jgi:hypothetical protein